MSGRSAYVRKEKTKVKENKENKDNKDGISIKSSSTSEPPLSFADFPMPSNHEHPDSSDYDTQVRRAAPARSIKSGNSDDMAYARVKRPQVPVIDVSGIEKSSFRSMMDKRSDGVRKGLAGIGFGRKKKSYDQSAQRPPTSATIRPDVYEVEAPLFNPPPPRSRIIHQRDDSDEGRSGPPQGKLPSLPPPPQLKRWAGAGRPPQPWNKLRKDPELWDPHGDTLVFLGHEINQVARQPASFRLSSHVLEATESRFFVQILREGYTDCTSDYEKPPSAVSSANGHNGKQNDRSGRPTASPPNGQDPDGQISYELYFPAPLNLSKIDSLRHHVTTRNIFALLYQASLVGITLYQALTDLHERLGLYMPPDTDNAGLVIDYISVKGIDDARNDPATATSLLAWSEGKQVRWQEGWREAFVHCAGMHNRLDDIPEFRYVTPITKALLERGSLEVQVRVQAVEDRLIDFEFGDMWPAMSPSPPPERASFERLRHFLRGYYESAYGSWPAPAPPDAEQWLNRGLVQKLQTDFGALYDYLVDRDIIWDGSEERSGRKWTLINKEKKHFDADTPELPITDILVAFDNRHRYPHIPHPYPLVPQSISVVPKDPHFKAGKRPSKDPDNKIAERKAALAYTEATNIYVLGSDFISNRLVDAFVRFEKTDKPAEVNPFDARRGRWVLIYGILQVLASLSVDTPAIRYKDEVPYHLNPRLRGTPPWKGTSFKVQEASHEGSHCWIVPKSWNLAESPPPPSHMNLKSAPSTAPPSTTTYSMRSSAAPSVATSTTSELGADSPHSSRTWVDSLPILDYGTSSSHSTYTNRSRPGKQSVRSSAAASTAGTESDAGSIRSPVKSARRVRTNANRTVKVIDHQPWSGYGPGIEKVDEWPIREENIDYRVQNPKDTATDTDDAHRLIIKDFDDFNL